jgi:hypothetical protein
MDVHVTRIRVATEVEHGMGAFSLPECPSAFEGLTLRKPIARYARKAHGSDQSLIMLRLRQGDILSDSQCAAASFLLLLGRKFDPRRPCFANLRKLSHNKTAIPPKTQSSIGYPRATTLHP